MGKRETWPLNGTGKNAAPGLLVANPRPIVHYALKNIPAPMLVFTPAPDMIF